MEYSEEDFLLLSGIQHFCFCQRQWALIHIDMLWEENLRTVEGEIMHEKCHDNSLAESRKNVIISRGMPVFSRRLGISGECDVVEFIKSSDGITLNGREGLYRVYPVEYKHGKPKSDNSDILQLCAQAICLEEMTMCKIDEGALFYGETRRRQKVMFTDELRSEVEKNFELMHQYMKSSYIPKVKQTKACNACSLKNLCLPKLFKKQDTQQYILDKLNAQ